MVNQHPEQLARERVDQKRQDGGRLVVQGSCQVKGSPHTLPELDPMNDDPIQQLERGCPQYSGAFAARQIVATLMRQLSRTPSLSFTCMRGSAAACWCGLSDGAVVQRQTADA